MTFPIATSSAEVLATKAEARGMSVTRYYHIRSGYIRVTLNDHSEMLFQSQSNLLGRVTARIFSNKALTSVLLQEGNFPVPEDTLAKTEDEVVSFLEKHSPIVVKPINATGGNGVYIDVTSQERAREVFVKAESKNDSGETGVVCQQQVSGRDYRLLVINKEHVFAVERVPASVTGDGTHTIQELLEINNKAAASGYEIPIDRIIPTTLSRQGFSLDSIPPAETQVQIMRAANSHLGGKVVNCDDVVGENVKQMARDVASHFNCPVLGLDCMSENINESMGYIIELNEAPALYLHEHPDEGAGQPVGDAILDMIFPESKA